MYIDKKQIYIVDDDESVRRALKFLMIAYKFSARTFTCAEEFFSAVPNSAPGCLILDIHLPGLKGFEAQQRLLRSGSKRPIIIITADGNVRLKEQAIKIGAVGFFQKPINDQDLVDLINKTY